MAQNILRYYKAVTIELLEDLLKFMEGEYFIGDGKKELRKEGKPAIEESISFLKAQTKDI